ncbi:MAG: phosphatase PAP2 family protein [Proteobacteria bacterium]|nr:phosphatase PAP2 family protein [Pseudomonadota bacterium]MBU1714850.1 phosphatase PAP2 family protein [Pseudomonadota bacterium]
MAPITEHIQQPGKPGEISPFDAIYRRYWLPDLLVPLFFVAIITVLCWLTDLDLVVSNWFFKPDKIGGVSWPYQHLQPWLFLKKSDSWLVGIICAASLAVLVLARFLPRLKRIRLYALFVICSMVLGPGIVVNNVFKEYWGRPRPRQIVEYNGKSQYLPPLAMGISGHGESFPSGHAAAGFGYTAFWFVWRRKRRLNAVLSLAGGLALGGMLGVARLAAGAHFLSDIVWSFFLPFLVSLILYYFVFRIPQREDFPDLHDKSVSRYGSLELWGYGLLGLFTLLLVLVKNSFYQELAFQAEDRPSLQEKRTINLSVDQADVSIVLTGGGKPFLSVNGLVQGFGLPNNKIEARGDIFESPEPVINYTLETTGWFTELEANLSATVAGQGLEKLTVRVNEGDITLSCDQALASWPVLDLHTAKGKVVRPEPDKCR